VGGWQLLWWLVSAGLVEWGRGSISSYTSLGNPVNIYYRDYATLRRLRALIISHSALLMRILYLSNLVQFDLFFNICGYDHESALLCQSHDN